MCLYKSVIEDLHGGRCRRCGICCCETLRRHPSLENFPSYLKSQLADIAALATEMHRIATQMKGLVPGMYTVLRLAVYYGRQTAFHLLGRQYDLSGLGDILRISAAAKRHTVCRCSLPISQHIDIVSLRRSHQSCILAKCTWYFSN